MKVHRLLQLSLNFEDPFASVPHPICTKTCLPQSLSASAWPVPLLSSLNSHLLGSGKTTFMQRLNVHLHTQRNPPYVLNLDPAVLNLPYEANIDIRDTINYKEVMKQ